MPSSPLLLVMNTTSCVVNFYAPPYRRFFYVRIAASRFRNLLIAAQCDFRHNYAPSRALYRGHVMATEYLLILAGLAGIAGFAMYKHFKGVRKSSLVRPNDR
ncbi:TPA: hypothetical protein PPN70_003528 [Serratia rubidaea]|uniref:hypothetical protein n=1 Tax=Serratia rubidaea TaxID=61652 RepID=UPI0023AF383B|nr:hypothetical protein [Serratia rubidaea]MDK1702529.1 hypothetical protein [Serratia rubidaea]HDJ1441083.1 hypothetical protein [Serratia rubidaea]HDJ1450274.1 hypothetical protein [Serratia rubidaea]HDJ1462120.1 hypothetical protein [Serratia rubidaea]HDJ2772479.1 hypothetical protein [Serratia rubidaea]